MLFIATSQFAQLRFVMQNRAKREKNASLRGFRLAARTSGLSKVSRLSRDRATDNLEPSH
jgi:hypothetical protein